MLVEFWMVLQLTREVHSIQKRMMDKQIEMSHYASYASRLGSSTNMSISNLAGLPTELLPRASLFAQYLDQASSVSASQNLQMMQMMGRVPITGNQMIDMQIQMSAYNQFKQEAIRAMKEQEKNVLSEKEKEIQLELNTLSTTLKIKQEQLQAYKQRVDSQAKNAAPDFG